MKIFQLLLVLLVGLFPFALNVNAAEDIYFTHIGLEEQIDITKEMIKKSVDFLIISFLNFIFLAWLL